MSKLKSSERFCQAVPRPFREELNRQLAGVPTAHLTAREVMDTRHFYIWLVSKYHANFRLWQMSDMFSANDIPQFEVPATYLEKVFPGARIELLIGAGLLKRTGYSTISHQCRAYYIERETYDALGALFYSSLLQPHVAFCDVYSGENWKPRTLTMQGALEPFRELQMARQRLEISPQALNPEALREALRYQHAKANEPGLSREEEANRRGQLANTMACLNTIFSQMYFDEQRQEWLYQSYYEFTNTGRLVEIGGGMQNLKGWVRGVGLIGTNTHNFDIKACQPTLFLMWAKRYGIECPVLEDYVSLSPSERAELAASFDLPVSLIKQAFTRILFGATKVTNPFNDFYKELATLGYRNFHELGEFLQPVYDATEAFSDALYAEAMQESNKGRIPWTTPAGYLDLGSDRVAKVAAGPGRGKEKTKPALRRFILAAWLQGAEAYLVAQLTNLGPKYGYTVTNNQHDGFLYEGNLIPQAAIDEALALAEIDVAMEGVEKPLDGPPADFGQHDSEPGSMRLEVLVTALQSLYRTRAMTPEEEALEDDFLTAWFRGSMSVCAERLWRLRGPVYLESETRTTQRQQHIVEPVSRGAPA